jgi:hypothetical protein
MSSSLSRERLHEGMSTEQARIRTNYRERKSLELGQLAAISRIYLSLDPQCSINPVSARYSSSLILGRFIVRSYRF